MKFKYINCILSIGICICLILGFTSFVYAEKKKAGIITKLQGTVEVKSRDTLIFEEAKLNQALYVGDRIRTKSDGWIEITLDNNNIITLRENSNLLIKKFVQDINSGEYKNILDMNLGKLRAKVERLKGNSVFEIHTPTAVAAARGTIIYIETTPELSKLLVEEGIVEFLNKISGMKVIVKDGETSSAYRDGTLSKPCIPSLGQKSGIVTGFDK
jgi:ABC-type proline/glycine betaine transport system ATPase subunit